MPLITVNLKSFKCYKDTSEFDSDEPYVLVFAANLRSIYGQVNVASAHTVLYGPWGGVDSGDSGRTGYAFYGPGGRPLIPAENFWGLDGKPAQMNSANDAMFLVALMENDNGKPSGVRTGLHATLFASLTSYANAKMSRADMVNRLLADMRDTLKGVITIGVLNNDDLIGVSELTFDPNRQTGGVYNIHINGDGGQYELFFESTVHAIELPGSIVNNQQGDWQWCNKCQGLTFAGNKSLGNCPAGGVHDHGGSGNYVLTVSSPNAQGQSNWQWCNKCQGLTFAGNKSLGNCPAGGAHSHVGSGNYTLHTE